MSRPILSFLALSLVALVACKPRQQCPEGLSVQLLANAGPDLNPCPNGAACAVNLRIYELKSGADLDDLDYAAIHERGAEVFGQNLVKPRLGGFHPNLLNEHFPKFWYWMDDAELAEKRATLPAGLERVDPGGPPGGKYGAHGKAAQIGRAQR